jgi:hypothetical protein
VSITGDDHRIISRGKPNWSYPELIIDSVDLKRGMEQAFVTNASTLQQVVTLHRVAAFCLAQGKVGERDAAQ